MITNSTVVANRSDSDGDTIGIGGGIYMADVFNVTTELFNSIVAGNVVGAIGADAPSDVDGQGLESTSAFNLIGDPATSGGLSDGIYGNIVGSGGSLIPLTSILEAALADNGGGEHSPTP